MYPAAAKAPIRARKSPRKALPPTKSENEGQTRDAPVRVQESLRATIVPPMSASPIPINTGRVTGSLMVSGASSATHSGVVVTSTTELATVVYSSEVIQVAKWTARNSPESSASPRVRRVRARSSGRWRCQTSGASTSAAMLMRAAAMTSEGAPSAWA